MVPSNKECSSGFFKIYPWIKRLGIPGENLFTILLYFPEKMSFSELFTLTSLVFTFSGGHYKAMHLNKVSVSFKEAK